jgi:hypothetical protein
VNVTVTLQFFPAPSVFGLTGQFPPGTKSAELVPVTAMLPIVSAVACVFLNVAVLEELDSPITWLPNDSVAGVSVTFGGPLETTRLTADPEFTSVPADGVSLITFPAATVLLDAVVTVPTTRLAPVIAAVAAVCVKPTTFGTETWMGDEMVNGKAFDAPPPKTPTDTFAVPGEANKVCGTAAES